MANPTGEVTVPAPGQPTRWDAGEEAAVALRLCYQWLPGLPRGGMSPAQRNRLPPCGVFACVTLR